MDFLSPSSPIAFLLFFVLMWFAATTTLGFLSGWYALMNRFPDRAEAASLTLRNQSGMLGIVGMQRVLTLSVCPTGLRVGMLRIFGLFCKNFFVPWDSIRVERKDRFFWRSAVLEFGAEGNARLSIPEDIANQLARSAGDKWAEPGPFPEETDAEAVSRIVKQWVAMTAVAAAFFTLAPRMLAPQAPPFPMAVTILFPAVVFAINGLIQYLRRRRT